MSAGIGFILVSGIVMGMLYKTRVEQYGGHWAVKHIGLRAVQLYMLGAFSRLLLASGDYWLRAIVGRPSDLPENYWHIVEGALLSVRYNFIYLDLLPLYAMLLLLGIAVIYLFYRGQWRWVLGLSFLLWHAGRIDPDATALFRTGFRIIIWQFPFCLGLFFGYYRHEIAQLRRKLPVPDYVISILLIGLAFVLLGISYQISFNGLLSHVDWVQSNSFLFDKGSLGAGRLIAALVIFAGLYEFVFVFWLILSSLFGWLFLALGQRALTAYLVQGFLAYFVTHLPGFPFPGHSPVLMGFFHITAVLFVWFMSNRLHPYIDKGFKLIFGETAVSPPSI
ncbi:MAG: hypothetical protein Kow0080_24090 [Candidatus Promineifilaceae bacterium]